jgi:predicted transcriptional regulator
MSEPRAVWQRRGRGGSFTGLGPLEVELLVLTWEAGPEGVSVRDLYEQLLSERPIAYTTVMTEMRNLTGKGLLVCDRAETAYRYRPAVPAHQVRGAVLDEVVRALYGGRAATAVAHLLGLGSLGETQLDELRHEADRLQQ